MKAKTSSTVQKPKQLTKEEKNLMLKNKKKEIEETKAMEKIFSGSCCHSGIHAYNGRSGN